MALLLLLVSFGEKISIEEARNKEILSTVTVEGYVTLEPGPFANNLFFIEKDGYGVNIYTQGKDISELNIERNDLIEVTGYIWNHKSNLEIVLETDNENHKIKILEKNAKQIKPREISVEDIKDEELEGALVNLDAKIIKNMGQEIIIEDETGEGILWIRENTGIVPDYLKEGLEIEITGVLAQYLSKKEIQPRDINDLVVDDIFPPEVQFYSITDEKQVKILFNESIDRSIIKGTNVKILNNQIKNIEYSFEDRLLTVNTEEIIDNNRLFLRFIKDKKGNNFNMKVLELKEINKKENSMIFDESHGQTAGNADWVLDGGYSDLKTIANDLGLNVFSLKENINEDILSLFDTFIIVEPNVKYSEEEIKSIKAFIDNSGETFLVSDHGGADRNGDGWDSVRIINKFLTDYGVELVGDDVEQAPIKDIRNHFITEKIEEIGVWNGTSIKINEGSFETLIFDKNKKPLLVINEELEMIIYSDSSTFDDGTGEPGDILHDGLGWGDNEQLLINILKYLKNN
jgi:DNA/RNA endonuclease YhcR with UshA esterase domain